MVQKSPELRPSPSGLGWVFANLQSCFSSLLHLEGKGWGNVQTYVKSRLCCGSDGLGESLWSLEGLQTPSGWKAADN